MEWKLPPAIKIYEALGAIGDGRVKLTEGGAEVTSSSGGKTYTVMYDRAENKIISNDNGSYYRGYLGYPAIAYLLGAGMISYDEKVAGALKGIKWKDVNQKYKNDFSKTEEEMRLHLKKGGVDPKDAEREAERILNRLREMNLKKFGASIKPPEGY